MLNGKVNFAELGVHLMDRLTHHNLYFKFADLQVVFIVDIQSFECTLQTLMSAHQKHNGKPSCKNVWTTRKMLKA